MKKKIIVVMPAYNAAETLRRTFDDIPTGYVDDIILVDDNSTDDTVAISRSLGIHTIVHTENRGYGAALKTGITASKHDTVVILDGDGTYPAEAIPKLLEKAHEYDMVVGARTDGKVHIPFVRKPAKWFLTKLAVYLAGQSIPDLNSGLRVMKKSVIERFYSILPSGFSFTTTITLAFITNNYPIYYHPNLL